MRSPDVVIAGAGLIGLSCALELRAAGVAVTVVERGRAGQQASWAAGGMIGVNDSTHPHPPELMAMAEHSGNLYRDYLEIIAERGGTRVPYETEWVLEQAEGWRHHRTTLSALAGPGYRRHAEPSLDPRKLFAALRDAVTKSDITIQEDTPVRGAFQREGGIDVRVKDSVVSCGTFLDCTGAWSPPPVHPAKGQMLRLNAPGAMSARGLGNIVVRTPDIYLIPRLDGTIVIGSTIEDAGFDRTVHDTDIQHLRAEAAALLPALGDAPEVERWAGLRPDTPDHLPLMGRTGDHSFVAAGHFRNGILLAPATAQAMAELILNEPPVLDLQAFRPQRFSEYAA